MADWDFVDAVSEISASVAGSITEGSTTVKGTCTVGGGVSGVSTCTPGDGSTTAGKTTVFPDSHMDTEERALRLGHGDAHDVETL